MASSDATPFPRKNVAYRVTFPIFDNTGALVTGAAGLDSEVSKDGGTFADCTNEATEIATASGIYYLDLTASEMNADTVAVIVKTSTTDAKTTPMIMYPEELGDIRVNVGQWNGTAVPSEHTAGYPIVTVKDGTGTGEINTNAGGIAVVDSVTTIATGGITAGSIAADAIGASELAADAVTEIQSGLATAANLATLTGYVDTEVASILAAVDTEVAAIKTVTDAIGATGTGLTAIPWNAAWDAEVQSEVQDAIEVNNLDHLVKAAVDTNFATTVHLDSVIGQLADNGTTATFDRTTDSLEALQAEHDATQVKVDTVDDFLDTEIAAIKAKTDNLPASPANEATLTTIAGYLDTEIAAILADTNELQTDWANGGRLDLILDARASQTSVDDLPTNAELATALGTADDATLAAIAALSIPSAATIADAVWDEDATAHQTQGTFGQAIGDPVADTNSIFKAVVTDATGATVGVDAAAILDDTGTSGVVLANDAITAAKVAADAIDASALAADAVTEIQSGLATASSITALDAKIDAIDDYIDTEVAAILADTNELQTDWTNGGRLDLLVDAIKAKTDNLPADPADASDIAASFSTVNSTLSTIAGYLDTEVAAIKAKTDNLPADPADASDIAASFSSISSTLTTIASYIDTEVAAILADTNELQTDLTNGGRLDLLIDAIKAKTDSLTFTVAGQVDSNIQYVNDVAVTGTGASGDEWGPA